MTSLPYVSLLGAAAGYLISDTSVERSIGGITADVTVSEAHEDEVEITQHPVEQGASISDHAFQKPARLTVRAAFSNSTASSPLLGVTGIAGVLNALSGSNYVDDMYAQLLNMQAQLQPITVVTGKRTYENMMIVRLSTETDVKTENALVINITLQQVIIVSTQTTGTNPANMSNPEDNAGTQNYGTQQVGDGSTFNTASADTFFGG